MIKEVYLLYSKKHNGIKRKKCKSVEQARAIAKRLARKDGYTLYRYGGIHEFTIDDSGISLLVQYDLFEGD